MTEVKYQCDGELCKVYFICPGCLKSLENKYNALLEFVNETDFIELNDKNLKRNAAIPDDSYLRQQSEYVLRLKKLLREMGEIE